MSALREFPAARRGSTVKPHPYARRVINSIRPERTTMANATWRRSLADEAAVEPQRPGDAFPRILSLAPEPPAVGSHVTDCRTGRHAEVVAHLPYDILAVQDAGGTHWTLPLAEAVR